MAEHNSLGKWGEKIALDYLIAKGYSIYAQNTRVAGVEIDLIVMKDSDLVFVEIKTRRAGGLDPLAAIDRNKMRRMARAANSMMQSFDIPLKPRFDVITIIGDEHSYDLQHYPDAFLPPLRTY